MSETHKLPSLITHALPVMFAYVAIGIPCGVLESAIGLTPLMAFLFSVTYYSGAGQFMISQMGLAGFSPLNIAATISFMNTRQILYATAFAPHFTNESLPTSLVFASTVTDESFGVNLDRYARDPDWCGRYGIVVNLSCCLSWATANAVGCALGPVINLPMALLTFGMTAIFICLAATQRMDARSFVVMGATSAVVLVLKLVGAGSAAVLVGSIAGVASGLVFGEATRR